MDRNIRPLFQSAATALIYSLVVSAGSWLTLFGLRRIPGLERENGPMENFEAGCLAASLLLLLWNVRRLNGTGERIFSGLLALFFVTFLILEVDLRHIDIPFLVRLMNGTIRDLWLGALWIIAAVGFVRPHAAAIWRIFTDWLRSVAGGLMLFAGLLWLASAIVDKAWLIRKDRFIEESLEVPATILMLCSVILLIRRNQRRDRQPVPA